MPRLISIDLGAHQVKLTTWRQTGRGPVELEERHAMPVPQSGEVPDLAARMAALDALLDEHPSLGTGASVSDRCVLALPGELATYHRVVLPFADQSKVESTLEFALEEAVPFDLDDMVVGWRAVSVTDKTEVLAVVARHERVREWVQALAERSLDPERVYVDVELLGGLAGGPTPGTGATAVVDVGHSHTALAVVLDGEVRFCRTISVGGWAFTKAIQRALGCDWSEAEARKHGEWSVEGEPAVGGEVTPMSALPDAARQELGGAMGLLLAELKSTLIRTEDELGVEINEVRLAGGGSAILELRRYLANDLGLPVLPAEAPEGEVVPPSRLMEVAGLSGLRGNQRAVDLRVGDLTYRGGTDLVRMALTYGAVGTFAFALMSIVIFVMQYRSLSIEQSAAEAAISAISAADFPEIPSAMSSGTTAVTTMAQMTADAQQRATMLGSGANVTPPTIDLLATLTEAFPKHTTVTVEVRNLSIGPDSLNFEAETDGYASSAKVEEALQSSELFKGAVKGDETRLSTGRVRFPISIPLGDEDAESGEEG